VWHGGGRFGRGGGGGGGRPSPAPGEAAGGRRRRRSPSPSVAAERSGQWAGEGGSERESDHFEVHEWGQCRCVLVTTRMSGSPEAWAAGPMVPCWLRRHSQQQADGDEWQPEAWAAAHR
jgi:hypothetical protein